MKIFNQTEEKQKMKYLGLRLMGILGILLIYDPGSLYIQGQSAAGLIINGTKITKQSTSSEVTNPSNQTSALELANESNLPSALNSPYETAITPSPTIPGASTDQVPESVICYINNRINQVLATNSERDERDFRLALVFNERRKHLAEAILLPSALKTDTIVAEQAIRTFLDFVNQYSVISRRLESAIEDLIGIETDPNQPISLRYEALMLINQLQNSDSITNAQKALQSYADFKRYMHITPALMPALVFAPLSDEYKKYFQQIFVALRRQAMNITDSAIPDFLRPFVMSPEELEELAEALKDLCDDNDSWYQPSLFSIFPRRL